MAGRGSGGYRSAGGAGYGSAGYGNPGIHPQQARGYFLVDREYGTTVFRSLSINLIPEQNQESLPGMVWNPTLEASGAIPPEYSQRLAANPMLSVAEYYCQDVFRAPAVELNEAYPLLNAMLYLQEPFPLPPLQPRINPAVLGNLLGDFARFRVHLSQEEITAAVGNETLTYDVRAVTFYEWLTREESYIIAPVATTGVTAPVATGVFHGVGMRLGSISLASGGRLLVSIELDGSLTPLLEFSSNTLARGTDYHYVYVGVLRQISARLKRIYFVKY